MVKVLGEKFGFLTVVKFNRRDKYSGKYWDCVCDCGIKLVVRQDKLRRGKRTSCGCQISPQTSSHGRKKISEQQKKMTKNYNSYRRRARKKKIEFSLTKDAFISLINSPCVYCGETKLVHTIDRISSKFGYTEQNTVPACLMCNLSKNKYSKEVFLSWIDKVYRYTHTVSEVCNG